MNFIKNLMVFFVILFLLGLVTSDSKSPTERTTTTASSSNYKIGYLSEGALWYDSSGNSYRNSRKTQVEIWDKEIVASNGQKLIQIYFLEGANTGVWAYTTMGSAR